MAQHILERNLSTIGLQIPHKCCDGGFIIPHDLNIEINDEVGYSDNKGAFECSGIIASILERRPARGDWSRSEFKHPDYIKLQLV